jgi:hypothetical protein
MKKWFLVVFSAIMVFFVAFSVVPDNAVALDAAECKKENTSVLMFNCDKDGIFEILDLVVTILTYGVGVLAIGAVVFAGIKYASAGGSEERVRSAKKMIFDTVIGLLCYAVLWTALKWLVLGW